MTEPAQQLNAISATEAARRIADGTTTSEAVVNACLDRISAREDTVKAWAHLDPELALTQAQERDRSEGTGPLHGVPIGIKDIIDTFDMPTGMGSPIYEGNRTLNDAACVALVRAAGAVILGKTVTAEFAGLTPGRTANPHDPARTPGGSSSGSAAAVGDDMVPLAFGTQTGGSVLRPSSYCGIFGYKPSFGTFNLAGVLPAAQSLDTLGIHARHLDDIALLSSVLTGRAYSPVAAPERPPKIGLCRTFFWDAAEAATIDAIDGAAAGLAAAGADIRDVAMPDPFPALGPARETINSFERARVMAFEWNNHRDQISEQLQRTIERGQETPFDDYVAALNAAENCRASAEMLFEGVDVLLAPCVDGEAPEGLGDTGSPRFQGFWTLMHVPTITVPTHRGPTGMPVGIQLVGRHRQDDRLLSVARWVVDTLGTTNAPA